MNDDLWDRVCGLDSETWKWNRSNLPDLLRTMPVKVSMYIYGLDILLGSLRMLVIDQINQHHELLIEEVELITYSWSFLSVM